MSVNVTDEEVWELVSIALDSGAIMDRGDGISAFSHKRQTRMDLALSICERNLGKLPLRIRDKVTIKEKT